MTFSHLISEGFLRSNARAGRRAQLKNGTAKDKSANLPIFDTGKYGKRIFGRHFPAAYRIEDRARVFFGNAKISKQDTNDTLFYGYVGTGLSRLLLVLKMPRLIIKILPPVSFVRV